MWKHHTSTAYHVCIESAFISLICPSMKLASTSCCRLELNASPACVRSSSIHFVWIVIRAYLSCDGLRP